MIDDEKDYKKVMDAKYKIYCKKKFRYLKMPQEIIQNISGNY